MENNAHQEPSRLSYQLIKDITNNFDETRFLGRGTFGAVYKGVHENGREIAVKVLHGTLAGLEDTEFQKEFDNLSGLKHPNIVELLGFCNESVEQPAVFEGKQVTAITLRMALCFEYVHGGSLHKHITDESTGFNWHTRYRIIKGVCEGLKYLRERVDPIMHFDLKPDNILLGKNMEPKIADFGSSKLFGEENTTKTMKAVDTIGYWPPEYIQHQITSREFDIFSLGVIIVKIMTGHEGYNSTVDLTTRKAVRLVHESWKKRLIETVSKTSLEAYCNQVKRCIEIALRCLKPNRQERPTIQEIVSSLNETETMIGDRGMQNEQFNQDDGDQSTLPSDINNITINSGPSSGHDEATGILDLPAVMSLDLLREMTDDFSEARLLGQGEHGSVYQGIHGDGQVIAVKKLHFVGGMDNKEFQQEMTNLIRMRHPNILQLVGYCNEIAFRHLKHNEQYVVAKEMHMVMCFEYMRSGSLEQYISPDMNSGLDWRTRYGIIKGMCEGVRYLHDGLTHPLIHLNLKPSNILMGEKMMPKIADAGLARIFNASVTSTVTMTVAYLPPEFINRQVITKEFDIFSLGIIILQLMTGRERYLELYDMPSQKFIDLAKERWRKRLHKTVKGTSVGGYCQQVKECLEIAVNCVDPERRKRPSIAKIVHMLNETEQSLTLQLEHVSASDKLLDVHPLELSFPSAVSMEGVPIIRKKKVAMASSSSCSLQLQNKGDDRVAFMLVASNPKRYLTKKPLYGIVPPRCAYTLTLTMPSKQQQPPRASSTSSNNGGDFFTLYSIMLGRYDLLDAAKDSIKYDNFFKKAKESTASAGEDDTMQEVTLKAICDRPTDQGTSSRSEIITTTDAQQVSSIDVHPTEPWIMTTNHVGSLRVCDYHTMAALNSFQLAAYEPVHAAKFIARKKIIVAGDRDGGILVYNYENEDVHSFDAHDSCVTTLAVHPTSPFVLSSSEDDDHLIKLWDWDNGWKCTREFGGHTDRVTQVTFNPENNDSFASASWDGTVKIWSICSDDPSNIITLKLDGRAKRVLCADYFTRYQRQHLIMGCEDKAAQIWALGIKGHVDMLEGHEDPITAVKLHPELPFLMTGSLDGTVRIWDSTTYTHWRTQRIFKARTNYTKFTLDKQ